MSKIAPALGLFLALAACGAPAPDLDSRLSDTARDTAFPELVSLDPILATTATNAPRDSAAAGRTLEARAAQLRRRAAALRAMPVD